MRRLVVVRHGESVWNAEGRIQGQSCAGLSARGHAQAEHLGRSLAAAYPHAELVSSDLQRTVETAAPLAAVLGVESRLEKRLRERSFGSWEGQLRDEVRLADDGRWQRWLDGEDVVAEVGGEPGEVIGERARAVFAELLDDTPWGGVTIAVTHGGTIWHGTHGLLELAVPALGGVSNAAVAEFVIPDRARPETVLLDRWNEVAHLPAELRTGPIRRATSDAPPAGR